MILSKCPIHLKEDTVPYLTAGYSFALENDGEHGIHLGAGLNRWVGDNRGFLIGGRISDSLIRPNRGLAELRVGIIFR